MSDDFRYLSTFTGIGGFDVGFDRVGMRCVGMVEIDKHCMSILNRHWPEVPKHDDIRTARTWCDEQAITGNVELVIGGAPCQDLSRAGKQAGFDGGERSVLYFDMVALAAHVGARWFVYENVPGLLTSNGGRDFGAALLALAEAGFTHVEWRVLDSQHFGVPQRRERVIVVACAADLGVCEVLTEPEGLHWRPETRFTARQDAAGEAPAGARSRGGLLADRGLVSALTQALGAGGASDSRDRGGAGHVPHVGLRTLRGGHQGEHDSVTGPQDGYGPDPDQLVTGTYTAGGAPRFLQRTGCPQRHAHPRAAPMTDTYAKRHRASSVTDYESWVVASVATTLNAYDTGDVRTTMIIVDDEPLGFIPNAGLDVQYSVRRLTPTECERLQGFPDEHTRWDERGKEQSDTQRYKQLGNAVSVPVASYVGALIMHVDIRVFR